MSPINDNLTNAAAATAVSGTNTIAEPPSETVTDVSKFPAFPWTPDSTRLFYASAGNVPGIEQFRSLRSRVRQLRAKKTMQSVLVSSALMGEGKTFVAANLAMALAKQNGKVLLVDADLRKPTLHEWFGAPAGPGLAEHLAGTVALTDVIQRGPIENLWLLPGGTPVPDAAELVANNRISSVIEKLAKVFDWIVLDSSPVLPVSDAVTISHSCDAVLLVAKAGVTQSDDIQTAKHEFRDARVLGLVLNGVAPKPTDNSYFAYEDNGKPAILPMALPTTERAPSLEFALRGLRPVDGLNRRERRRSARYELAIPIRAEFADGAVKQYVTTDLSEHGLGLRAERQLETGVAIKLSFTMPSTNTLVEVRGDVIWSDQDGRCGIRMLSTTYTPQADLTSKARE